MKSEECGEEAGIYDILGICGTDGWQPTDHPQTFVSERSENKCTPKDSVLADKRSM